MANVTQMEPMFVNISDESEVTEIESLCMNCHENGSTKILMTKIPFFKEMTISRLNKQFI